MSAVDSKYMNAFHSNIHITNFVYLAMMCTLNKIHLIISRAPDNAFNTSTLKMKSHNIKSFLLYDSYKRPPIIGWN